MPAPTPLVARSGQLQETDHVSGPNSYATGGFSVRTNIGRVDNQIVEGDNATYEFRASVADNNAIVVSAYSQSTGTEVAANTDLSGVTVTYTAFMQ